MQTTMLWVRWIARIWSIISIGLLLMFFVGEGLFDPHTLPPTPSEWIMLLFFPAGVIIGMMEGWRYEKAGGLITVFSLTVFYIINLVVKGQLPGGLYFLLMAMPGFLFLLCGKLDEQQHNPPTSV